MCLGEHHSERECAIASSLDALWSLSHTPQCLQTPPWPSEVLLP